MQLSRFRPGGLGATVGQIVFSLNTADHFLDALEISDSAEVVSIDFGKLDELLIAIIADCLKGTNLNEAIRTVRGDTSEMFSPSATWYLNTLQLFPRLAPDPQNHLEFLRSRIHWNSLFPGRLQRSSMGTIGLFLQTLDYHDRQKYRAYIESLINVINRTQRAASIGMHHPEATPSTNRHAPTL